MSEFEKSCEYCSKTIIMKQHPVMGTWTAYEYSTGEKHKCNKFIDYKRKETEAKQKYREANGYL